MKGIPTPPSIDLIILEGKKKKDKLRDDFAMRIAASNAPFFTDQDLLCKYAYEVAEKMLKERDNYL